MNKLLLTIPLMMALLACTDEPKQSLSLKSNRLARGWINTPRIYSLTVQKTTSFLPIRPFSGSLPNSKSLTTPKFPPNTAPVAIPAFTKSVVTEAN